MNAEATAKITPTQEEINRFWSKTKPDSRRDCINWTAYLNEHGYGRLRFRGRVWLAHRLSFYLFHNKPIGYLCVLHSCDNPACVNPSHLSLGTQLENMQQCSQRGRKALYVGDNNPMRRYPEKVLRGAKNGNSKLDDDKVEDIRALALLGATGTQMAKKYNISIALACMVIRGKAWKHVPMPAIPTEAPTDEVYHGNSKPLSRLAVCSSPHL